MTDDDKKRAAERLELLGALRGEVMVFQPTTIRQISTGGMQVETAFPLQLNSLHDFRLTLGDRSIVLKGRVAHSRISDVDQDIVTYSSGVQFIEAFGRRRECHRPIHRPAAPGTAQRVGGGPALSGLPSAGGRFSDQ
jgi:hypothetical protein